VDWGTFWTFVSAVISAGAVVVAVVTLRHARATAEQARRDLREDRRIDFQQALLLQIAEAYEEWITEGSTRPFALLQSRVRILPDLTLPLTHAAAGLPVPEVVTRLFEATFRQRWVDDGRSLLNIWSPIAGELPEARRIREDIHAEIAKALDELTAQRP
jgi:hypothetical protein